MDIQFSAKHLFLIANEIQYAPVNKYLKLITTMKTQLTGVTDLTQLITVSCTADNLIEIYTIFGRKSENNFAGINKEMKNVLLPQIQAGIIANIDSDWARVAQYVTDLDNQTDIYINSLISSGQDFINS